MTPEETEIEMAWGEHLVELVVPPYGLDEARKGEERLMRLAFEAGWIAARKDSKGQEAQAEE